MLAGYARRHYGAIMSARDTVFVQQGKLIMFWCFIAYMYNKSFIDQACSVKMAGYLPRFFCVYGRQHFVLVHKHAKKKKNFANI